MSKVRIIPPTVDPLTQLPINSNKKLKVAAYARVSTQSEEQATSYEAQINYYEAYIKDNPEWEYVKVYADEGITGTSTRRRTGFNEMIKDAINGKINLIITKSISRFARNTLDTISFVRKLKEHGVEVYFENENIWTLDSQGELLLTLMASIAQEESRNISERVKWGKRAAFKEGRVSFAYSRFLGYEKVEDEIVIVEDEAKTVERIYKMFLVDGETPTGIAKELKRLEIKTPSGKNNNWTTNNIISILTNEKYKGDALLQKTFTENYLDQTIVKNTGQVPQYYVENSHPAIIERDMWELVQVEMKRRDRLGAKYSAADIFSSKLVCSDCGGFYGKKKWHSNTAYERFVYQCNSKFQKGKCRCQTPHLTEDEIKEKFIEAYNLTMEDKERITNDLKEVINLLIDTTELEKGIERINAELSVVVELAAKTIKENSKSNEDSVDYENKYQSLVERHEALTTDLNKLLKEKTDKENKATRMKSFLSVLNKSEDMLNSWNERIWMLMVEKAIIQRDKRIKFILYGNHNIEQI
jgi:site-specific DNA recombinase